MPSLLFVVGCCRFFVFLFFPSSYPPVTTWVSWQALAALVPTEPEHFATVVLPRLMPLALSKELVTRHGAMRAIAEILAALCEVRAAA